MATQIPWKRLLAESVVVIFSILAAFGIDAWWQGRQTREREAEVLKTLQQGFEENLRWAAEVLDDARRQDALLRRFVIMSPAQAAAIAPDSTYFYLRALWRPNGAGRSFGVLNNSSLVATLDQGRLALVSDTRVLKGLADWQVLSDALQDRAGIMVALEQQVLEALSRHSELQSILAGVDGSGAPLGFGLEDAPVVTGDVVRRVREDNEVMSRVARKGFASRTQVSTLEQISAQADSVLTLVRSNLRR